MQRIAILTALIAVVPMSLSAQETEQPVSRLSFLSVQDGQDFIQQVSGECATDCCDEGCDTCCGPFWCHRHRIFGEYLYLTAREQHLDFATPVDGATATAVPLGRTAVLDPGYESGWRMGAGLAIDRCTSLVFEWTNYENEAARQLQLPGGNPPNSFLRSEITHPSTVNVAADSLAASGSYGIDFQVGDVGITRTLKGDCCQRLNGTVGLRYGNIEQDLRSQQRILTDIIVNTDIDFEGYGPRFALDYERQNCKGLLAYARGGVSLLFGRADADYLQRSVFAGTQAAAGIFEHRLVPQCELELGAGWESPNGAFRLTGGYLLSAWSNLITTPSFIDGVQANEIDDIDETLIFDGLTVRAEILF